MTDGTHESKANAAVGGQNELLVMRDLLNEAYSRFRDYEMDVDSDAPQDHREFMKRLKSAVSV